MSRSKKRPGAAKAAAQKIAAQSLPKKESPDDTLPAQTSARADRRMAFEQAAESDGRQSTRRGRLGWQWAIVLLYGAVVLAVLPYHEPARDEAEPWLIARDLSFVEIIQNVPYAGHPPLWYLLQAPLAKLGFPFVTVGILNALCMTAAVAVLVFWSPFLPWEKAAASFSMYLVFVYGMVWRNYCLVLLGFFLVAAAYPARGRQPICYALAVALLANGCVPSLMVALLLLAVFVIDCAQARFSAAAAHSDRGGPKPAAAERSHRQAAAAGGMSRRNAFACLIMAAAVALNILALIPPDDVHNKAWFQVYNFYAPLQLISGTFVSFGTLEPFRCGLCVLAFAAVLWDLRRKASLVCLVMLAFLGWSYVFIFKNPFVGGWHMGLMVMLLIMALWIARAERRTPDVAAPIRLSWPRRWIDGLTIGEAIVFGSLAISVVNLPQTIVQEIREPFSNGKEMAAVVASLEGKPTIATYPSARAQSILPYLPDRQFRFWHIETGGFGTFCKETAAFEGFQATTQDEVMAVVRRGFPAVKPWLLLGLPLSRPNACGYRLVYQSRRPAWGFAAESFWLYQPTTSGAAVGSRR